VAPLGRPRGLDADGFLAITGRKKEIIITSGGKNITPKNIEAAIKQTPSWARRCSSATGATTSRRSSPSTPKLVRELGAAGVPVAVLSNSEGKLFELVVELGWEADFLAVADSGKLGMEKPERPIFEWTRERLGVAMDEVVHVGDSVAADVAGALRAGMRAVWFKGEADRVSERLGEVEPGRLALADDAPSLRAVLSAWGLEGLR
jgi:HAD superfamily hydrolase (TIGR01662 family)